MHTQASPMPGVKGILSGIVAFLISKLTSRHGKRIIFITSLYFHVVRLERLQADAVSRLNEIMGLASNEAALKFPVLIRDFVWKNVNLASLLTEDVLNRDIPKEQAVAISERVVDNAPKCLRYGRRSDMVTDVVNLICNGEQLAAAA